MIDAWLVVDGAAESCGRDTGKGPPTVVEDDERPSGVAEAGVHVAVAVAGAKHFLMELHLNVLMLVPLKTFFVAQDGHSSLLKHVRSRLSCIG